MKIILNAFLLLLKACDWQFDFEAFKDVSEEGKDFIRKLLVKQKEKRLTAHECLQHAWLTGDHSHKTLEIARQRFFAIRDKIRQKVGAVDNLA